MVSTRFLVAAAGLALLAGGWPAASAAVGAKKTAPVVAEEPERKIEGVSVEREKGGFIGVQLIEGKFVMSFYDAAKVKIAPDVTRAALRWKVRYQPTDERLVLNPSDDGSALTSPRIIRPPHRFRLFFSLFVEGENDAVENYSIDFSD